MSNFLLVSQLFISIILITLVLMQPGSDGGAGMFGGSGETYHTRKGIEKLLHYATIFFIVLFIVNSIALLIK
jgi:protein translocase SecG subunit